MDHRLGHPDKRSAKKESGHERLGRAVHCIFKCELGKNLGKQSPRVRKGNVPDRDFGGLGWPKLKQLCQLTES